MAALALALAGAAVGFARDVPLLAKVNILVTTDVHSWIAGHAHPDHSPQSDAAFGSLVSFHSRMKKAAAAAGRDVWLFDNGDVVDGTGLSGVTRVDGAAVFPLLQSMPYDALNLGNHELYHNATVTDGLVGSGFIRHWNGTYLSSNTLLASTDRPLGARYKLLRGAHGSRILVFGFLYNMRDACSAVRVVHVQEAVREAWFAEAMAHASSVDAIVVMAHMHCSDPLVPVLLDAIRHSTASNASRVPVLFLTGHSHVRCELMLEKRAASFEAGHYGDTLGFASIGYRATGEPPFAFQFLEMNEALLAAAAGMPSAAAMQTPEGRAVDAEIARARALLGVSARIGCASLHYEMFEPLASNVSIWRLYLERVAPEAVFAPARNASQWFITSTGSLRYELYAGNVTVDDIYAILPFSDRLFILPRVSGEHLRVALLALNSGSRPKVTSTRRPIGAGGDLPDYLATSDVGKPLCDSCEYDAIFGAFDMRSVVAAIEIAAEGRVATPVRYNARSTASGLAPPANDTAAWLEWVKNAIPCGHYN